jgi:hypothetical protein
MLRCAELESVLEEYKEMEDEGLNAHWVEGAAAELT